MIGTRAARIGSIYERLKQFLAAGGDPLNFAKLSRAMPDTKGDHAIYTSGPGFANIYIWANVSHEFTTVFAGMEREKELHTIPCSVEVYQREEMVLMMPVCTGLQVYDRPHWMPVLILPGPYVQGSA